MEQSESEKRLQDFAKATSEYFWEMDENLRFTYVSDNVTEITGMRPEQFIGKTRQETGAEGGIVSMMWQQEIDYIGEHLPFRDFEQKRVLKGGNIVYVTVNGIPVFDDDGVFRGYRGTCRETTELRKRDTELSAQTAMLQTILYTDPALITVLDNDNRVTFAHRRMAQHYEMPLENMRGKTIEEHLGGPFSLE